ncbi:universal stress protein [Nocardioides sp. GXQ0305]|uniref:universal stress protein n=1 Tax=Nocardioides sp. GXQ0305 TaxID=3423912 RepID=UPI003D7EDFFC
MQTYDIPTGTVAVGVDGSPGAEQALTWAADEARTEGRPLTVVHAVNPVGAVWMDQAGHDTRIGLEAVETDAQRLLGEARATARQHAPALEVHDLMRVMDPRDLLLAVSGQASMLVIGSRGRGPVRSLLLGSVGVAVTRHAQCPVVVVRPHHRGLVRRGVLVGVDDTERSRAPLEFAFRQAAQRDLPLTVVHAFQDMVAAVSDPHLVSHRDPTVEEQRLLMAEAVAGMREKYPDVAVRTELARGHAGDALVRLGDRMNLVVVGAHHGGAASAVMFGSVATSVVDHASCPVAVVPTADR